MMTALMTGDGMAYIDLSEVFAVSAATRPKKKYAESRRLMTRGNATFWILNTAENNAAIAHLLPPGTVLPLPVEPPKVAADFDPFKNAPAPRGKRAQRENAKKAKE